MREREPRIDRLLGDQLLEKLKAQRVTYGLRKQVSREGRLTYGLQVQGTEGWGQFRKALFAATNATQPLTEGPTQLELIGNVKAGEPLALILEANLASGYAWEIQTLEALKLKSGEAVSFQSPGNRLGGADQANYFSGRGDRGRNRRSASLPTPLDRIPGPPDGNHSPGGGDLPDFRFEQSRPNAFSTPHPH